MPCIFCLQPETKTCRQCGGICKECEQLWHKPWLSILHFKETSIELQCHKTNLVRFKQWTLPVISTIPTMLPSEKRNDTLESIATFTVAQDQGTFSVIANTVPETIVSTVRPSTKKPKKLSTVNRKRRQSNFLKLKRYLPCPEPPPSKIQSVNTDNSD